MLAMTPDDELAVMYTKEAPSGLAATGSTALPAVGAMAVFDTTVVLAA
jgi:hypothetical protein